MGRFLTKDTWDGIVNRPLSLNHWNYGYSNPINYTDPSGHISCKDIISSWRSIFTVLHLCNPDEEPTLTEKEIEFYESLDETYTGNSITCGLGYISYGFICVPIVARSTIVTCDEKSQGLFQTQSDKDDDDKKRELDEKCEMYHQEYEGTIEDLRFIIFKIRQIQRALLTVEDLELRRDLEGQLFIEMINASNFEYGARLLLHKAIMEGCDASWWSPIPNLP